MFGGVGERTREGNDLYTEMVDSKVIVPESLPDSKVSLIYGQMNEPPGARMRVGLSALTVAEFFREHSKLRQPVLGFVKAAVKADARQGKLRIRLPLRAPVLDSCTGRTSPSH